MKWLKQRSRGGICGWLFDEVDGLPLALFRVCFGLVLAWDLLIRNLLSGAVTQLLHEPVLLFSYPLFRWVPRLKEPFLSLLFLQTSATALLLALGIKMFGSHLLTAALFFIGYTWQFLMDATRYNNHYYLISLLAALFCMVAASDRKQKQPLSWSSWRRDLAFVFGCSKGSACPTPRREDLFLLSSAQKGENEEKRVEGEEREWWLLDVARRRKQERKKRREWMATKWHITDKEIAEEHGFLFSSSSEEENDQYNVNDEEEGEAEDDTSPKPSPRCYFCPKEDDDQVDPFAEQIEATRVSKRIERVMRKAKTTRFSSSIPRWQHLIFQFQILVVYFYGGIAKLNEDWLRCEPMAMSIEAAGQLVDETGRLSPFGFTVAVFLSYGGLFFDLLVPFLLVFPLTRYLAIALTVWFHISNWTMFDIGMFPLLMICSNLLFVEAEHLRSLLQWMFIFVASRVPPAIFPSRIVRIVSPWHSQKQQCEIMAQSQWSTRKKVILVLLILWVLFQVLFPLRHFLYHPGHPMYVHWSEEGQRFSWHMKLRFKAGNAEFIIYDPDSGYNITIQPFTHMKLFQWKKVSGHPEMLWQYAQFLYILGKNKYGFKDPQVFAKTKAVLNDRPPQQLINATIDLAHTHYPLWRSIVDIWVLPLNNTSTSFLPLNPIHDWDYWASP
ncbi:HTTM domain-containing protein [Balamuthia mandrillaris]